jgi:hypothetical protein
VLSPSSAESPTCAWEVHEAVALGKRILPAICRALNGANPPPELAALNYMYFYAEPKFPSSGFGKGLVELASALNTDSDWLREHTRYLRLAKEWEDVGKPPDGRLLSAADIALAKTWAEGRPAKAPEITALHATRPQMSSRGDGPDRAMKSPPSAQRDAYRLHTEHRSDDRNFIPPRAGRALPWVRDDARKQASQVPRVEDKDTERAAKTMLGAEGKR